MNFAVMGLGLIEFFLIGIVSVAGLLIVFSFLSSDKSDEEFSQLFSKNTKSSPELFQQAIHTALQKGWRVELQTTEGATLSCGKKIIPLWARVCMILGILGLPAYGLGLVLILVAIFGFIQAPHKTYFISAACPVAPPRP